MSQPGSTSTTTRRPRSAARRSGSGNARETIVAATADVLRDRGASALSVHTIMKRAGITRTTFYRQFSDVYQVVEELIRRLVDHMTDEAGAWLREVGAVGSPDQIHPNLIRSARAIESSAALVLALHDATGMDERLRRIWREQLLQPRIDAVARAIRRDQDAGAISPTVDADATALALSLMNERLLLELICRNGADPDDYARVAAPIWEAALFGEGRRSAVAPSDRLR